MFAAKHCQYDRELIGKSEQGAATFTMDTSNSVVQSIQVDHFHHIHNSAQSHRTSTSLNGNRHTTPEHTAM
eukprot:TRINITY_DN1699_c0_g2_i1.p2 TRINITY_DN1699_c0_g2~~TRINITY_DN1699_c0_g2_i1.p2  ORF type:complete len:71 (-),score=4.86 TRINITY_DN1699_c0_g2_i1:51-263(-)